MASKAYNIAFKLAAKLDKSYNNSFALAEEIASRTVGKLAKTALAIGGTVLSVDKIQECTEKAMGFESAMADVAKVVDGLRDSAGNATDAYYKMSQEILDMTERLPMTGEELAQITAAAGQANIAAEDLTKFTETAAKMGIAFDVSADQAGEWMAGWRTSFNMSQSEVTALADQINYLSNTSTENASKLSEVVNRIGSLGEISGLSAAEIAAIGASMTGVTAEISATGIKNLMKAMNAGSAATNKQEAVLKQLGHSAEELAERMQVDAKGAILDLLSAFRLLPEAERSAALTQYFGSESVAAIAPLLANLENLEDQFTKVGDASLYAGSMESEFATRAATTENKMKLAQNAIDKLQIAIGNLLLPIVGKGASLFADAIGNFTEKIPEYASKAGNMLKNAWKAIEPAFTWIRKNPMLIAKSIGAIGAAIATHKVVDGIMGMSKAFSLLPAILNPTALILAGIAGTIGLVAAAFSEMNRKAKLDNLAAHFGDISLSLAEAEEVAKSIVRTENLNKVSEALNAFSNLESIEKSIESVVDELNKAHWKVSIGLELTTPDIQNYRENINTFITDAQELLLQEQYALNIALNVFTDNTAEGIDIRGWVNLFYQQNSEELSSLGEKLRNAVNDAFNGDGVLTMDEVTEITNLQHQISEITEKLARSQFEAKLEVMGLNFSGASLTGESFKTLQESINAEVQKAASELDDALVMTIASAKVMYEDGFIDAEDYKRYVDEYKFNYLENLGEITLRAANFQTNTLFEAYETELAAVTPDFASKFKESINAMVESVEKSGELKAINIETFFQDMKDFKGLDSATRANITEMFKSMQPTLQELQELEEAYESAGKSVPESLSKGITDIVMLGALTGDAESLLALIGSSYSDDSQAFITLLGRIKEAGGCVPEEFTNAMRISDADLKAVANGTFAAVKSAYGTDNPAYNSALSVTAAVGTNIVESMNEAAESKIPETKSIGADVANSLIGTIESTLSKGVEADIPIKLNVIDPRTPEEKLLSNLSIDYVISEGSAISPSLPTVSEKVFIGPVPGNATGSAYTTDTFIAGERGPELITNAAGSRVYNALETRGILSMFSRLAAAIGEINNAESSLFENGPVPESNSDNILTRFNKVRNRIQSKSAFEINFSPQITIDGGAGNVADIKRQIMSALDEFKPELAQIIRNVIDDDHEREMRLSNA